MSGSSSSFFAAMNSTAQAMGDLTTTNVATNTAALPGAAIGYSVAIAVAQDVSPGPLYTSATTGGVVSGGYIESGHTGHMSVDFPYGSTPVSVDVSVTSLSSHGGGGDALSAYGLASPTLHGLF
jgi:hypothetical protein